MDGSQKTWILMDTDQVLDLPSALFLKSVINFVRSNNIQCEIYVDQSYEILSLLYYRDCFNL